MGILQPREFHVEYNHIVNEIKTNIGVFEPFSRKQSPKGKKRFEGFAIWDTGATISCINPSVAEKLGIVPTGKMKMIGVNGSADVNTYYVNILLPSQVGVEMVLVAESSNIGGADILIGMDIIKIGDLCISNVGITRMSFRIPSTNTPLLGQQSPQIPEFKPRDKSYGRNDYVEIKSKTTGETKRIKWKLAEQQIKNGDWELVA